MEADNKAMYLHFVNYRDRGDRDALIDRGFWIHNLPRILLVCRLRGHKAVVDGTEGIGRTAGHRWVCCDRCGLRASPQVELDAARWSIGDRYPDVPKTAWPAARGTIGGQLLLGCRRGTAAVSLKVGNCGSEHMLAGHVSLGPIGALYLHTEGFGTGIQRRLNPTDYHSRVTEIGVADGLLYWRLWAKRDEWSQDTPRWRDGHTAVGIRDRLLGPVRYSYETHAEAGRNIRMPDGDDYYVHLKLERQLRKRKRSRGTASWKVEWSCRGGIPTGLGRSVSASAVVVSDESVERWRWAQEACAAIAADISKQRTARGWAPAGASTAGGGN